MKRFLSILLAALMLLTFCVPAFADVSQQDPLASNDGKITITNAAVGETYTIYKIATLESFSGNNYSYWVPTEWRNFFLTPQALVYFNLDATTGYLQTTTATMLDANKKRMAKEALEYALANNIAPAATPITATTSEVVFDTLELGYYVIDTTLGTLCSIDTTDKEAMVQEKNNPTTIEKSVKEDHDGTWGKVNDADLFQTIEFRSVINCKDGAENYVVHDKMTNMEFHADSLKVYKNKESPETLVAAEGNYTLVTEGLDDGCTFHVVFSQAFCDTLTNGTRIGLFYEAHLTDDAVRASTGNPNETYMTYGNSQTSESSTTTTYTYEFDVVKTNNAGLYLPGATFSLWRTSESTDVADRIDLVKDEHGHYRIALPGETPTVIELPTGKAVTVTGLDGSGVTYYLQEESAPVGYNQLTSRVPVTISDANRTFTEDGETELYKPAEGGIQVINKTGAVLPSTGGFGTTMFIVVGTILVLGTGVLLATKLRMSKIAD